MQIIIVKIFEWRDDFHIALMCRNIHVWKKIQALKECDNVETLIYAIVGIIIASVLFYSTYIKEDE